MNGDFERAKRKARERMTTRESIGRLNEKELHATLKFFLDPDENHHEVKLADGPVADIFDGKTVTEIQTGSFSGFRPKLIRLLEDYPVTVVLPLPFHKTVCWIDPETGERSAPRKSPKVGAFWDAAPELIFIMEQLFHPGLTVRLMMLDMEEYRLLDGLGNGGRRGAHRLERIPVALGETAEIKKPEDLRVLLPEDLAHPFTSAQYGKRTRMTGRRLTAALKLLQHAGVITRCGQDGRRYLYTDNI